MVSGIPGLPACMRQAGDVIQSLTGGCDMPSSIVIIVVSNNKKKSLAGGFCPPTQFSVWTEIDRFRLRGTPDTPLKKRKTEKEKKKKYVSRHSMDTDLPLG